ncbi:DNA-directed RNA polymerase [Candidatus Woesearchaeota archaeon]|nr:DNA-directed RNA polymerase [Candidatus Woesearchaeota archaeon]
MFYKVKVNDHIRVEPKLFGLKVEESVTKKIKEKYEGYISQDLGIVVDLIDLLKIKEGTIIPGDGASYFETEFELLTYEPELQEVTLGRVKDVSDFGVFMTIGPIEGMIHISQTMDDFVSFSKDKVLAGKESKRVLKVGDKCKARIIAVSYKDISNPKIGLTMRQQGLGKLEWLEEAETKVKK